MDPVKYLQPNFTLSQIAYATGRSHSESPLADKIMMDSEK